MGSAACFRWPRIRRGGRHKHKWRSASARKQSDRRAPWDFLSLMVQIWCSAFLPIARESDGWFQRREESASWSAASKSVQRRCSKHIISFYSLYRVTVWIVWLDKKKKKSTWPTTERRRGSRGCRAKSATVTSTQEDHRKTDRERRKRHGKQRQNTAEKERERDVEAVKSWGRREVKWTQFETSSSCTGKVGLSGGKWFWVFDGGGLMKRNMKQRGVSVGDDEGGWWWWWDGCSLKSGETENWHREIQDKKLGERRGKWRREKKWTWKPIEWNDTGRCGASWQHTQTQKYECNL